MTEQPPVESSDLPAASEGSALEGAPEPKPKKKAAAKKATTTKKAAAKKAADAPADGSAEEKPTKKATAKKASAKKSTTKKAAPADATPDESASSPAASPLFQAPEMTAETPAKKAPAKKTAAKKTAAKKASAKKSAAGSDEAPSTEDSAAEASSDTSAEPESGEAAEGGEGTGTSAARRRRRRGGRRRRRSGDGPAADGAEDSADDGEDDGDEAGESDADGSGEGGSRRRRTRAAREPRSAEDQITAVSGSTRLEAKKQRRREGREAGRRRAPIVSEAEFLARRESVDRVMVVRQRDELTQIGVLEDKVLVEHYVARESQTSLIGNVYLGRVQNVLPSMEAAFIDIGKGRNAVLYAGEVNWSALGHKDGTARKVESVLSSGQSILVQVTKDPIGHKGARLTSQISLAGRFLVYVPDGTTSGISRKLPDTERNRLKNLLKEIVPDTAGVIVRTAAEGAKEEELIRDVERLKAQWEAIEAKTKGSAPQLLHAEPDLTLKVVRDLFTEDFNKLVIQGQDAWDTVQQYVAHVAPDLEERLERYEPSEHQDVDLFATYRVDEQIAKGLDRKVFLPSGGSLVIDRTEAMTVVDVNTGKFTGSGGNLEETVTKNNLEAAEEVVRQLRLRDIGGIIVVDFIDMVLESNRDLVLRRLVECLGRDRTRHQVAEVTSLGLVQMTRKRIGTGLLEAFSESCEHCAGRGLTVHDMPIEPKRGTVSGEDEPRRTARRSRGGRGRAGGEGETQAQAPAKKAVPSPADVAAMAHHHAHDEHEEHEEPDESEARAIEPLESVDADPPEEAVEVPEVDEVGGSDVAAEPADEAVEPQEQEPVAPEPPKVVTRTRRRSATVVVSPAAEDLSQGEPDPEPAEAPEPAASVDSPHESTQDSTEDSGEESAEDSTEDEVPALHVPIKRRGRR